MNSLWGKFAQKWIETDYAIKLDTEIDFEMEDAYPIWNADYMLIKNHKEDTYASKPIQNGIFTLSYARYHMKKVWDAGAINNAKCIYSDTDSFIIQSPQFNLDATFELNGKQIPVIGDEIGQLELECKFDKLMFAGKKQCMGFYIYFDNEGNPHVSEKKRFKGIPANYIVPKLYIRLLNKGIAEIQFLKFRREWGSVKGYIESKNVRAT